MLVYIAKATLVLALDIYNTFLVTQVIRQIFVSPANNGIETHRMTYCIVYATYY